MLGARTSHGSRAARLSCSASQPSLSLTQHHSCRVSASGSAASVKFGFDGKTRQRGSCTSPPVAGPALNVPAYPMVPAPGANSQISTK